ncbi:hypothetical protein PIIN_09145 [Serendipita indica DSM 11827]|uniref:Uncharacterized protein n=1 Tax=Serendipita indica (strain DSM 11827) TaxID=1109443 RepID=G4TV18_SERID|nr:hypothetical protein PIIN_09145 [Serendipita indica DSM 11827]
MDIVLALGVITTSSRGLWLGDRSEGIARCICIVDDDWELRATSTNLEHRAIRGMHRDWECLEILAQVNAQAATVDDIPKIGYFDKYMEWMPFLGYIIKAGLAHIEVGALQALEAVPGNVIRAEFTDDGVHDTRWGLWVNLWDWCTCGSRLRSRGLWNAHRPDVHEHSTWSMERDKLMSSLWIAKRGAMLIDLVDHAGIAKVEVGTVETLVGNSNDRVDGATITRDGSALEREGSQRVGKGPCSRDERTYNHICVSGKL